MKKIKIIAIILLLFFASPLFAGTYYVDDDGEATWANCEHDAAPAGAKSGTSACSLSTANSNVAPGDTVYLRAGTYYPTGTSDCIYPKNSGTSGAGNRITFSAYTGESVIIDGTNATGSNDHAIMFGPGWVTGDPSDGRDYITVKDITFQEWQGFIYFYYASYNEIDNCTFIGHTGGATGVKYYGAAIARQSDHNYIHDCTFHDYGNFEGDDNGVLLSIGFDVNGTAEVMSNYNTIEDNHFYAGAHHALGVCVGKYNVVRNNYAHGEGWCTVGDCTKWDTGVCGYRVFSMTDNSGADTNGYNLIEDNYFGYGAQYGGPHLTGGGSGSGMTVHTDDNIIRYNRSFGNVAVGLRIGSSIESGSSAIGNHIYNNTFYYNGYNLDSWGDTNEDDTNLYDNLRCAFMFYRTEADYINNNVIKNNLSHDTFSETNYHGTITYYPAFYISTTPAANNTITNNWGNVGNSQKTPFTPYADPKFVDPDIDTPMDLTFSDGEWTGKPDLRLQSDSPAIDGGTYLTTVPTVTDQTHISLADASYFQDGTWGSSLATLNADYIAIGTVTNTAQIKSINYSTNTVVLTGAPGSTINVDDKVWLHRKSDGTVVLNGMAPDYGAHEFTISTISPPQNVHIEN